MLTYIGDHDVTDAASDEKPTQSPSPEKEVSHGLENLHFMDEPELSDQISEGVGLQPSPSLSDKTEESAETGLVQLKDEFLGQKYSLVLLPKKYGEGTQRLVMKSCLCFSLRSARSFPEQWP